MEICEMTGLEKNVHIEYFLGEKSLGKTMISNMSFASIRIKEAKDIGIDYYDRFVLNGEHDSLKIFIEYNGELKPQNDFTKHNELINER